MMGDETMAARPADDDGIVDPVSGDARRTVVEERLATIRDRLAPSGEAAWLTSRANMAWATAGARTHVVTASETGVAGLLVARAGTWLVTTNIEAGRLRDEELGDLGIEVVAADWWAEGGMDATAARLAGGTIRHDAELEPQLLPARSRLGPTDTARMAVLGRFATRAVEDALATVEPGTTEDALAADLLGRLPGVRAPVVLAAADDRIARYRHPLPGGAAIRARVMLVLVAEAWGLHAAVTRFRELEAPSPDLADRVRAVRDVQLAMTETTVHGATLGDVFAAAQTAYAAAGFPEEWRDHHQGGTIGYRPRESIATPGDRSPIEAGMAFAWNPSIAGTKVEDTFILDAGDVREVVTRRP